MKEFSAGAVIFYVENDSPIYLLLYKKRKNGFKENYDIPKGNIEHNESLEETAKREIREETGLDVEILPGFKEKLSWFYRRDGKTIYKEATFFVAKANSKKIKLSYEHDDYFWLSFDQALSKLKFKNQKELLRKAHQFVRKYLSQRKLV